VTRFLYQEVQVSLNGYAAEVEEVYSDRITAKMISEILRSAQNEGFANLEICFIDDSSLALRSVRARFSNAETFLADGESTLDLLLARFASGKRDHRMYLKRSG